MCLILIANDVTIRVNCFANQTVHSLLHLQLLSCFQGSQLISKLCFSVCVCVRGHACVLSLIMCDRVRDRVLHFEHN